MSGYVVLSGEWKLGWAKWRNRTLASDRFQVVAARLPVIRRIARSRAKALFDLVAGFTYSQVALAVVESGLLSLLAERCRDRAAIAESTGLSADATDRLLRAAAALELVEEILPGKWMLGQQGAVLHANPGAQAMIRHHRLLYADLADPLDLLKADRGQPTALSDFWTYARAGPDIGRSVGPYSQLMAASQAMVGREACAAYDFGRHRAVLDIGGGHGRFAAQLAEQHPQLRLGIFDLPDVVTGASVKLSATGLAERIATYPGDFFRDPIAQGYDCHTLVRILHDHDDERAAALLAASRRALPPGGRVVIVEPMAGTRGAEGVGAYFEMYLWAMGSGRPRTAREIGTMLSDAGFSHCRSVPARQPIVTSLLVASV